MPCPKKVWKEIYKKKNSVDEGVFPEYIEMVESPS